MLMLSGLFFAMRRGYVDFRWFYVGRYKHFFIDYHFDVFERRYDWFSFRAELIEVDWFHFASFSFLLHYFDADERLLLLSFHWFRLFRRHFSFDSFRLFSFSLWFCRLIIFLRDFDFFGGWFHDFDDYDFDAFLMIISFHFWCEM